MGYYSIQQRKQDGCNTDQCVCLFTTIFSGQLTKILIITTTTAHIITAVGLRSLVLVVVASGRATAVALLIIGAEITASIISPAAAATGIRGGVAAARIITPTIVGAAALTLGVVPWVHLIAPSLIASATASTVVVAGPTLIVAAAVVPAVIATAHVPAVPVALSAAHAATATTHLSAVTHIANGSATHAATAAATTSTLAAAVHLLLAQGFLHIQQSIQDCVRLLQDHLINGIVIIKFDKGEPALLSCILVRDNVDRHHSSELVEILPQAVFLVFVLQATDKQFLDRCPSVGPADVLTWYGTLWLYHTTIHLVRTRFLGIVHHVSPRIGYETETTRTLRLGILHYDHVDHLAPLLEMRFQRIIAGPVVQSTNEQLSQMLQFANILSLTEENSIKFIINIWGTPCTVRKMRSAAIFNFGERNVKKRSSARSFELSDIKLRTNCP